MAGHSQFKNIMHRKGIQDAKRAKIFTKLIRELTTAARQGSADQNTNPRLRAAVVAARIANMPRDTIDRAIKRGAGHEDGTVYESIRYEGFGPAGVAIIIEALTDNRNRTASEIRAAFSKQGGNLGESNSVAFMFQRKGLITIANSRIDADRLLEIILDLGADDLQTDDENHYITAVIERFGQIRDALEKQVGDIKEAKLSWIPNTVISVQGVTAEAILKLVETLEDNDDVQSVFVNAEIAD
ncbi:MAG TPA: YebC/PmpR family DNA-binding transcriptional regulator [Alphaproteobacteria bacterium]|nr:YebC/PmpR family DNA-binding transcriptional regulator [Alphaproteobacteria bacterium]